MVVSAKHIIHVGPVGDSNINFNHPLWNTVACSFHIVRMFNTSIELMLSIFFQQHNNSDDTRYKIRIPLSYLDSYGFVMLLIESAVNGFVLDTNWCIVTVQMTLVTKNSQGHWRAVVTFITVIVCIIVLYSVDIGMYVIDMSLFCTMKCDIRYRLSLHK